jgi:hypothetical protein
MTGIKDFNYHEFEKAKNILLAKNINVVSPHDIHDGHINTGWTDYMKRDVKALLDCDSIVLLPGWENSKGATLEFTIAKALGFTVYKNINELVEDL